MYLVKTFLVHQIVLSIFAPGYFFFGRKKDSFGPGEGGPRKGVKEGQKGPKKNFSIFFHRTCGRAMTGPHNRTCGARAVLCGITAAYTVNPDREEFFFRAILF